jgi:hypothetical protein
MVNKLEGVVLLVASFQSEERKTAGKDFVLFTGAHTKHSGLYAWKWMALLPALLVSAFCLSSSFPHCHFVAFLVPALLAILLYRNSDVS